MSLDLCVSLQTGVLVSCCVIFVIEWKVGFRSEIGEKAGMGMHYLGFDEGVVRAAPSGRCSFRLLLDFRDRAESGDSVRILTGGWYGNALFRVLCGWICACSIKVV